MVSLSSFASLRQVRACAAATIAVTLAATAALAQGASQQATTQARPSDPQQPSTPPDPIRFGQAVDVIAATPLHGAGVDRNKVSSNVQTATDADLARLPGGHLGDLLGTSFSSVHINEAQSNPFQPDIQFRGFTASPLLGLPQGLAIYQNGVRINEPFGDAVNWDVLPSTAIASVNLMPGSNPMFGLNALGGAISLQTKTGFSHPGQSVTLFGGSFGRAWADVSSGGSRGRVSYFVTGRVMGENGWRDYSDTRVRQVFANVEWRGEATAVGLSMTGGANRMIGNGAAPVQLLDEDRRAVFTHPDRTTNHVGMFSLNVSHRRSATTTFESALYYRPMGRRTFNGDDTTYGACEAASAAGRLCYDEGEGEPVFDTTGRPIPLGGRDLDATNNTSYTHTHGWGGSVQASFTNPLAGRSNQLIVGGTLDGARVRYDADTEIAFLTDTRGTVGIGALDPEAAVRLKTNVQHVGAFVADFLSVTPRLTVNVAARVNRSDVELLDQLGDDLNGDHNFSRVNPSAGATFAASRALTVYGSYATSSRVPTPSELSCADPEDPCRLPNAFVADPPLKQVVSHTAEGGARGTARGVSWSAALFRTVNKDDLIFISSGALTNSGHFENVGDTLRRGFEAAVGHAGRRVQWNASYTYLRATFGSDLVIGSPNHPDEEDGELDVPAGSTIPSVPRHNVKARLGTVFGRASVAGTVLSTSSQYLRGDEANLLDPVAGYAVVNLNATYRLRPRLTLVGQVTNLFDRRYATFGVLGEADDVLGDDFENPRFVSPGAPRGAWIGVEWRLP